MSEPSKGTQDALSIRSVAGGFIVSWQVPDPTPVYTQGLQSAGQLAGKYQSATFTVERVCAGLPSLLALISETIKVRP